MAGSYLQVRLMLGQSGVQACMACAWGWHAAFSQEQELQRRPDSIQGIHSDACACCRQVGQVGGMHVPHGLARCVITRPARHRHHQQM